MAAFQGLITCLSRCSLDFPGKTFHFVAGKTYEIIINADINSWWQNPNDIKIAEHAVITSPGKLAKEISDNYANMFHIEKITFPIESM